MSTESGVRWQSWAAFVGAALLFVYFWQFMVSGSILVGCNPALDDARFANCDIAVGQLQHVLLWGGPLAIAAATGVEWRWHWRGSALLAFAALAFVALAGLAYA